MNYEQKYNKLVNAIKVLQETNPSDEGIQNWVNDNVPELAESEDERIRKEIAEYIHRTTLVNFIGKCKKADAERWIAWLEKRKSEVNVTKFKPGDKVTNGISTYTIDSIEDNYYRTKDGKNIPLNLEYRWKLVENGQKPKTAFHEGDWIVQENIGVYKVIEVCESWYEVIDIEDNHYSIGFDKEYMCHLWSIQDVKPGDVLTNGKMIVIFKNFEEPSYRQHIVAYIGLDRGGSIQITDEHWELGIDKVKPATKEQCELLFQKMQEYGYKWNDEKKELLEIGEELTDFEKSLKHIMIETLECGDTRNLKADAEMLLRITQEPKEWSHEDDKIIEEIINDIECARAINYHAPKEGYEFRENWLKSIKDKVQPQPKQEWSEEDEQDD